MTYALAEESRTKMLSERRHFESRQFENGENATQGGLSAGWNLGET